MAARLLLEEVTKRRAGRDRSFELTIERLELAPGEVVALVGPNGCGKSTAAELVGLGLAPDRAARLALTVDREPPVDVAALWRGGRDAALARLRARHFGYVPQVGALLPFLTVHANIALPQRLSGRRDPGLVRKLAELLDVAGLLGEYPASLSVGQRQRVAIARALAHAPGFVVADEPTAALDPGSAATVMELLVSLVRREGVALLVVSHDVELLARSGVTPLRLASEVSAGAWRTRIGGPAPEPASPQRRSA